MMHPPSLLSAARSAIPVLSGLPTLLLVFAAITTLPALTHADDRPCGPANLPPALQALVPQGHRGADFRPACRRHDDCYVYGGSKKSCDRQFLNDLRSSCEASARPRACRRRVRRMYVAVRLFGRRAYRISRR
jgi:hypothetical protein